MAKRARGTNTRPGQRARLRRRGPLTPRLTSPTAPPTISLTPQEDARAAELESEIVAEERRAEQSVRATRESTAESAVAPRVRAGSIALRAAQEYGYVVRDVRRIVLIGGSLIALLIVVWAITEVSGTRFFSS